MTGEENSKVPDIEFMGDLTNMDYLVAAIWVEDFLYRFIYEVTAFTHPFNFKETSIGTSGKMSTDFQVYVPGLILVGIIMLLFTSAIALVGESERRTLNRLKLSNLSTLEFIGGVCFVQVLLGLLSVALTLAVAFAFGFDPQGSWGLFLFVIVLASISMIAFGVIVAAFTRTVNAVLIVGNFPLFLFMFFTGAFFPMHANELFSVAGYKITIISLLSPSHAVEALKKVMLFQEGLMGILPEVISIILLTILYLSFGLWAFKWRHMRAD
jgi:ABC-2 type transport system permease protein